MKMLIKKSIFSIFIAIGLIFCMTENSFAGWQTLNNLDFQIDIQENGDMKLTVYRYEQSGELHGLTRVRSFTQDDAHIFCTPEQLKDEFCKVIDIVLYIFKTLKFENFTAQISLRDPNKTEKYIGSDEVWEKAERAIIEASAERGLKLPTASTW